MILELPFSNDPAQSFVTQLGDRKFHFDTRFNDRSDVWTLDLADATTKTPLVTSLPLVLGQDLLEPYNLGIGSILCIDTSGQGADAGPDDLGRRVKLYWFSSDEVASD